jgi:hypothetical protein
MNLKESYRYANYLDNLLITAHQYLSNRGFVTTTIEEHLRSKANNEASDEVITAQKPYDVDFTPNDVIDFAVKVIKEKESLQDAIAKAKAGTEINIDNAISMNKKKQQFVYALNNIVDIKPSEKQKQGSDYKFNFQDGNQIRYYYNVIEKTSIQFDRNDVKGLIKKISKECDEVSAKLDAIEINTAVNFEPTYDVNDKFEDVVLR